MAAVEVTISGMLYDKLARTQQNVVLIGQAFLTGLGVGGGPVIPPEGEKPPLPPLGIWPGPGDPDYPIKPPGKPPVIDGPPVSWKPVWTPSEGWVVVGVINPDIPHPVPSGGAAAPKK